MDGIVLELALSVRRALWCILLVSERETERRTRAAERAVLGQDSPVHFVRGSRQRPVDDPAHEVALPTTGHNVLVRGRTTEYRVWAAERAVLRPDRAIDLMGTASRTGVDDATMRTGRGSGRGRRNTRLRYRRARTRSPSQERRRHNQDSPD